MKLTLAKVLARKYQQVVLYLTLGPLCLLITFANSLDPDQARHFLTPAWYWKNSASKEKEFGTIIKCVNKISNIRKSKSRSKYTFSQICNF